MLSTAVTQFQEENPLIEITEEFLQEHGADMVTCLWGQVTNFRGKCKTATTNIVQSSYKFAMDIDDYPEGGGLAQAEVERDAEHLLDQLLDGSAFLQGVRPKRDNGSPSHGGDVVADDTDLNFMHDAIGNVVHAMLFNAHGGDQPVAQKYESKFRKYPQELMAAAATTMLCVFDQRKNPDATIEFKAENYRSYYEALLDEYGEDSIPKLVRDEKHGPRMLRKWMAWRNGHFANAKWAKKSKAISKSRLRFRI
ncbi:hypothetical protein C8R47DRAFT_1135473 [Mycena vitilis]|nr:hypothetical protein C8R47DRAFT_1166121 [Mycena vitilis]KAJ6462804.1 hypothetical protein C8R47DRAFT_1158131 [Mycena vitilis]KAJ6480674.1 hypothetical protein C8R47DRAFT_1135473 [Mycena vitilis]